MEARHIPNMISILRIILTVPTAWMLLIQRFDIALLLFLISGISDGLDGFLAKRFDWQSSLGGLLDPLADKFLLVSSLLALGWLGLIPWWLVTVAILRDLVIVTGATVYHLRIKHLKAEPSLISKINTVVQIVLVLAVVLDQALFTLPEFIITGLIWLTLATTLLSGFDYVWVWSRRAAVDRQQE
jgi:cardiolipin synthase